MSTKRARDAERIMQGETKPRIATLGATHTMIRITTTLAVLAALATPAMAQPIVSPWPGHGYIQQYGYTPQPSYGGPLIGTTQQLGGGLTSTQWNNGASPPVTCTTFPLGGGLTTTQCN